MMLRFQDKWWSALDAQQYSTIMAASPWFVGLAKEDLPLLIGDGSTSYNANEDDAFDKSEVFQDNTYAKDRARTDAAIMALRDSMRMGSAAEPRDVLFPCSCMPLVRDT